MSWSSAFYFGASTTVLMPIETITFEATDVAGFAAHDPLPVFAAGSNTPVFDFSGEPNFTPLTEGAQFNVEC